MTQKTIFITGGGGFIGSAVVRLMCADPAYHVVNLDAVTYCCHTATLAELENLPNYTFEKVDIADRGAIATLFKKYQPDGVIHLAAESHVDRSITDADPFLETNVMGTYCLLRTAKNYLEANPAQKLSFRFLSVSTDEVYGSLNPDAHPFREEDPYDPSSPYSASKASADHLVQSFYKTYGFPGIITNCSNNYGPYQFPEKLIPKVIGHALHWQAIPVYGSGTQIRDWLHVDDHAAALKLVFERGTCGEKYLVGGNNELPVTDIIQQLCTLMDTLSPSEYGAYTDLIQYVEARPGEDMRYAIDASKLKRDLGWEATIPFDSGLKDTVQWYLTHREWWTPLWDKDQEKKRMKATTGATIDASSPPQQAAS